MLSDKTLQRDLEHSHPSLAPSYYSVVQCVPDPLADERINVAVIAFDGDRFHMRSLSNWKRVEQFCGPEADRARTFVEELRAVAARSQREVLQLSFSTIQDGWRPAALQRVIRSWSGSIQFMPSEPAMVGSRELIDEIAGIYLKEPASAPASVSRRDQMVATTLSAITGRIEDRFGPLRNTNAIVQQDYLTGSVREAHQFDVCLRADGLRQASQVISLSGVDHAGIRSLANRIIYAFFDIRQSAVYGRIPLSLIVDDEDGVRGGSRVRVRDELLRMCDQYDVEPVAASAVPGWSERLVDTNAQWIHAAAS